jgi:CheY-like chemotaxis protein
MRARLLLVDDDATVREVTGVMLGRLGYRVIEAGSGGAALDALEHNRDMPAVRAYRRRLVRASSTISSPRPLSTALTM